MQVLESMKQRGQPLTSWCHLRTNWLHPLKCLLHLVLSLYPFRLNSWTSWVNGQIARWQEIFRRRNHQDRHNWPTFLPHTERKYYGPIRTHPKQCTSLCHQLPPAATDFWGYERKAEGERRQEAAPIKVLACDFHTWIGDSCQLAFFF